MIPIGDHNPTRRVPIVNYLLIAANILAFIYQLSLSPQEREAFILTWGARSPEVIGLLQGNLELFAAVVLTTLVSMFLHGGLVHIGSNMLFLWVFGDNVEDNFGGLPYLIFYLISGAGAVVGQALVTPGSPAPMIGASGAISGVLAAYLIMYPRASIRALIPIFLFLPVLVPAWAMIILYFVTQLFNTVAMITDDAMAAGGVAYGAHLGGFVVGFVLTFFFRHRERKPRYPYYSYDRRA